MARFASDLPRISRRDWLRLATAGVVGFSQSGWMGNLAAAAAGQPRKRSCILLWMNGGPSQMDTFDLKPGHANGGPFKELTTKVPGVRFSEHLPQLARHADRLAIVRSMTSKEGDHGRATFLLRTGNLPQGALQFPTIGSLLSKELGDPAAELPNFVSIAPYRQFSPGAYAPGFLGPMYAPLLVGETNPFNVGRINPADAYKDALKVDDLARPTDVSDDQAAGRLDLLRQMESDFASARPSAVGASHRSAYERAVKLMSSGAGRAFHLDEEPTKVRDAYGRNLFGQGCLLARRLVERGVAFVEVTLGGLNGGAFGWDTHQQNFDAVKSLSAVLDPAWGTLMTDLQSRGMLDSTLIVWMGEFGRTPKINPGNGRDHYPNAFSAVLAGGGIKGGSIVGRTSKDGTTVEDRPVPVVDFLSTVCKAVGVDHLKTNNSNIGRPIRIVDKSARPIEEVVA